MSQPVVNCATCGKPQALHQAPRKEWPTYGADILHMMKKMKMEEVREKLAKGEPVTINGKRLGVPHPPSLVPSTEKSATPATDDGLITVNGRRLGVPPAPSLVPVKDEPVTVNKRRQGVPDLPPLIEPKAAA